MRKEAGGAEEGGGEGAEVSGSGTLGDAPSAARVAEAGRGGAERQRGRQGRVPTACSRWKDLASPGRRVGSPALARTPRLRSPRRCRGQRLPSLAPGLARLSASASRLVLPLWPSSLAFLNPSLSLSTPRSPVEVSRSLCVWGVGRPHCFSCFSVLPRPCVPGSLSLPLWLPLLSFVWVSAHLGLPPPPSRLPPQLCRLGPSRLPSVSLIVPAPPELRSEPLCVPVSPGFSNSGAERPGSANLLPLPSHNENPVQPESPWPFRQEAGVLPPQFPTLSLAESWDNTPPPVVERAQLRVQCAKWGGGRRNQNANFGAGGVPG